jgi:hypothetical protein
MHTIVCVITIIGIGFFDVQSDVSIPGPSSRIPVRSVR